VKLEDTLSWSVEHAKKFKDAFTPLIKNLKAGDVKKAKLSEGGQRQESSSAPKEIVKEIYLVICPHCNHKNPVEIRFCSKRGASI
jgi:hypothetical protein